MPKETINSEKVTLAILGTKLDNLKDQIEVYHNELKEHIKVDEAQFEPLRIFKERVYAGLILISVIVTFLGWNQIQRLFTIEVIHP